MTSKKCCCKENILGFWCDHDHYFIDWFDPNNPSYDEGQLRQCKQPNWRTLGTLTTELPSVGHPMTTYNCVDFSCSNREPNPEAGRYEDQLPNDPIPVIKNSFRTPSQFLNSTSYKWGVDPYYGDISPCWFNGINMTNIESDDDIFFNLTFELKIEKLIGSSYQTIVDRKINGPARNIRPHPDTVRSYNVSVDHLMWEFQSGCGVFLENGTDDNGNKKPCIQDFARMPRGPWPYRFKRYFDISRDDVEHCYNPETGAPYTVEQVKAAKANPSSVIGTPLENMLQCEIIESECTNVDDGCCNKDYLSSKELCDQLDEEGTPFGWEDCPSICFNYSNHGSDQESQKLRFFGWLEQANRYTTPEWDVEDIDSGEFRKMSLHVLVPTQFKNPTHGFCDYDPSSGRSFGEWSFGMDYEAKSGEIEALESAGFPWSNGREDDGIWIHKTPTDALRVLFTLDHADLNQGKVWRVFKDWNVSVNEYVKTFNKDTPEETKFKITIKQVVEEKHLSSLGCDCPSGYRVNEDNEFERITPSSCDDSIPGYEGEGDQRSCGGPPASNHLHCMNNFSGAKISFAERGPIVLKMDVETSGIGCLVCGNSLSPQIGCEETVGGSSKQTGNGPEYEGAKFVINSGIYANNLPYETVVRPLNSLIYADLGPWNSESSNPSCVCENGIIEGSFPTIYLDGSGFPIYPPGEVYSMYRIHAPRYCGALADLPFPAGTIGSPVGGKRYRNNYTAIQQADSSSEFERDRVVPFGYYPHLYGDSYCTWTADGYCNRPSDTYDPFEIYTWASFNVKAEDFPTKAPIGNCVIDCDCKIKTDRRCADCNGNDPPGGPDCPPFPCPCCDLQRPEYNGNRLNCPELDPSLIGCCDTQPNTNPPLQAVCGEPPPPPLCRCECQEPNPDFPCTLPTGIDPARYGPYRNANWNCGANASRIEGSGQEDPYWTCFPRWQDGNIVPIFFGNPDVEHWLGMDSERIYFRTEGGAIARGFLGNKDCKKACSCFDPVINSNCFFEYCEPPNCNSSTTKCDYCEGTAQNLGTGLGDMFFNWRKYLCQKRTKENTLPDVKEIEKIKFECTVNKSSCVSPTTGAPPNPDVSDACDHLWFTNAGFQEPIIPFSTFLCDTFESRDRDVSIKVEFSKYDVPTSGRDADGWLPWNTKYEPNPGRISLPSSKNRSHIVITAKGLD